MVLDITWRVAAALIPHKLRAPGRHHPTLNYGIRPIGAPSAARWLHRRRPHDAGSPPAARPRAVADRLAILRLRELPPAAEEDIDDSVPEPALS